MSEEITNITFAAFMPAPADCTRAPRLKTLLLFMLTGSSLSFVSGRNAASVIEKGAFDQGQVTLWEI